MMDCIDAQRLISEQLDREPVDPEALESAKEHCRSCPECGSYVRTLVQVQRATLPEPPPALTDRVMDAIAAQVAADTAAETALETITPVASDASIPESPSNSDEISLDRLVTVVKARRNRKAVVAWAAAVALVFVVSGMGAVAGLRTIFAPARFDPTASVEGGTMYAGESTGLADDTAAPPSAAAPKSSVRAPSAAPNYISVGQTVYLETGEAPQVEEATLKVVGSTSSSLGGTTITTRDVLGSDESESVYVARDDGTLMAFERVARTYRSTEYTLVTNTLNQYGDWPTLPSGLPTPTNADGTPEYVAAGTDAHGVTVHRQANGDADAGIAVPPGTSASDPAAGNPNWTWWQPTR